MIIEENLKKVCAWCGYCYQAFSAIMEIEHLSVCEVFQKLPVAIWRSDGRTFVEMPTSPGIFVERTRLN
jgi:hypothetical protein